MNSKFEKYSKLKFIGKGSFGKVYKAYDTDLKKHIALKFLPNLSNLSNEQLAREYYLMCKDYSPYIAQVYGFYTNSSKSLSSVTGLGVNTSYIAMEYLDFPTLSNIDSISKKQKALIIRDLCLGIEHMHSFGIIHGDLKPDNIFVTDNSIKLVDFGLGSEKGDISDGVSGSLGWIAPEILQGYSKDITSDIYSLATIIFYIIYGYNPFEFDNANSTIQAHFKGINTLSNNDFLDSETKDLLLKMLRISPLERLKSPYYFRFALQSKYDIKYELKKKDFFLPQMPSLMDNLKKELINRANNISEKYTIELQINDKERYRKFLSEFIPYCKKENIVYLDFSNHSKVIYELLNIKNIESKVKQELNRILDSVKNISILSEEQIFDLVNIIEQISFGNKVICNSSSVENSSILKRISEKRKKCKLLILYTSSSGHPINELNPDEISSNVQAVLNPCINPQDITEYFTEKNIFNYSQISQELRELIANKIIYQTEVGWRYEKQVNVSRVSIVDKLSETSIEMLDLLAYFKQPIPSKLLLSLFGLDNYYHSYTELLKFNLIREISKETGIEIIISSQTPSKPISEDLKEKLIHTIPKCQIPIIWQAVRLKLCFELNRIEIINNDYSALLKTLKSNLEYKAALIVYEVLYQLSLSVSDFEQQIKYMKLKALMYKYQGKFSKSISVLSDSLEIAKTTNLLESQCNILNDLGVIYFEMGNFFDALNFYLDSENIAITLNKNNLLLRIRSNIAGCYHKMLSFDLAEKYYQQTLSDLETNPNKRIEAVIKYNSCELFLINGNLDLFSKTLYDVQSLCNETGNLPKLYFQSKILEIEFFFKRSNHSKALEILEYLETDLYAKDRFLNTLLVITKLKYFIYSSRLDKIKETFSTLQDFYWISKVELQIEIKKLYLLTRWFFPKEKFDCEFNISDTLINNIEKIIDDQIDLDSLVKSSRDLYRRGEFLAYAISIIKISQQYPPGISIIKDALEKLHYEESIVSGILTFELAKLYIRSDEYELAVDTLDSARVFFGKANNEYLMSKIDDFYSSISRKNTAIELSDTVALLDIINSINSNLNFDDTIMRILSEIVRISGADRGIFFRNSADILQPVVVVYKNNQSGNIRGIRYSSTVLDEAINNKTALFRERIVADDKLSSSDSIMNLEIKMVLCIPLICNNILLGAIYTDAKLGSEAFSQEKRNIIEILSKTASIALNNSQTYQSLEFENIKLKENAFNSFGNDIIGNSEIMKKVFYKLRVVAPEKIPVLLTGETGTGKDLLAKEIHRNSPRSDKPFITINCAAVPENLLESELFGYEKGAFTGAVSQKKGKFEIANEGTIFLNEIGEMPLNLQAKLLTVIENMTFQRLGGTSDISVDIRLITATNRDLMEQIQNGLFREDLYYRIRSVQIEIPPLRDRKSDIPLLINHFIQKRCEQTNRNITGITPEAMNILKNYEWKGNIRQLINIIDETVLFCNQKIIQVSDLPSMIQPKEHVSMSGVAIPNDYKELKNAKDIIEKEALEQALNNSNWNISETAKNFGINRSRLHQLINKYNLQKD